MSLITDFFKVLPKFNFSRLPLEMQIKINEYIRPEDRMNILMDKYRVRNVIEMIRPIIEENDDKDLLSLLLFHFGQYGVVFRSPFLDIESSTFPIRANKIMFEDLNIILSEMEQHENKYGSSYFSYFSYFKEHVFPFLCLTNYIFTKKYNKRISDVAWTKPLCNIPFCDRGPWDDLDFDHENYREEIETDIEDDKKYYNDLRRQKERNFWFNLGFSYSPSEDEKYFFGRINKK
jgi:hypothetical protein